MHAVALLDCKSALPLEFGLPSSTVECWGNECRQHPQRLQIVSRVRTRTFVADCQDSNGASGNHQRDSGGSARVVAAGRQEHRL
jgi:hypothetical protein